MIFYLCGKDLLQNADGLVVTLIGQTLVLTPDSVYQQKKSLQTQALFL
jgi:hypothetical protein